MYCPQCGSQIPDTASTCPACGAPLGNPYQSSMATPGPVYRGPDIPSYLVQSILATCFCCMPFGIVAIVYAAQVGSKLAVGDYSGAQLSSDSAKMWCWISFGIWVVGAVIYGAILVAVGAFR
ncbi:MAG TPA: CD225/dispanin family protein [Pirellulales bacterium]|jgi:hypothetical protein|nr:CD225/dispanin family protein [Pirellulales bacterium]